MAARKKKKAKTKPAKARKSPARQAKARKAAKRPAKKAKKAKRPKTKKQAVGEGDYAASRKFDKNEASFVRRNKANIPAMGKAAEKALEGPEGDALREAEATAAARSRDTF